MREWCAVSHRMNESQSIIRDLNDDYTLPHRVLTNRYTCTTTPIKPKVSKVRGEEVNGIVVALEFNQIIEGE